MDDILENIQQELQDMLDNIENELASLDPNELGYIDTTSSEYISSLYAQKTRLEEILEVYF